MRSLSLCVSVVLALCAGCERGSAPAAVAEAATPAAPEPKPKPKPKPEPPAIEPAPEAESARSRFDALALREARVRVRVVHDEFWVPCGVLHSVGVLEVEVLEYGEPPPPLILYVSCPADIGHDLLAVGEILDVKLHRRRQPWPKPKVELPEGVPVRYVSSLKPAPVAG